MPSEQRVYIVQLMCPDRHCICALAGEYDSLEAATKALPSMIKENFRRVVYDGVANNWCGICRSSKFHTEVGRTQWKTIQEAEPFLAASQELQEMTAQYIKKAQTRAGNN